MPAYSSEFPWPSHYGHFNYFEDRMRGHNRVRELRRESDGVYDIIRTHGDMLRTFICECYSFGVAEYFEAVEMLGHLDAIVINSAWCGYTDEAKILTRERRVGLFKIPDLMGALHRPEYWDYFNEWEAQRLKKRGML
jgi:hypothetical protein